MKASPRFLPVLFAMALAAGCANSDKTAIGAGGHGSGGDSGSGGDQSDSSIPPDSSYFEIPSQDNSTPKEAAIIEGGYDTSVIEVGEAACSDSTPPPAQISVGVCGAPTDNECDGAHDLPDLQGNVRAPNGSYGNGYDDDCDGLVDEGCDCGPSHAVGTTKVCYLMPSSWIDDATGLPVGWCEQNAQGTVKCVSAGGTPENPVKQWDGVCRGAQAPSQYDVCASGDFNCDGVDMNASDPNGPIDCACKQNLVQCPVAPLLMNPFPPPTSITTRDASNPLAGDPTQPFFVDGYTWVDASVQSQVTGWTWEVTGGDCDNIIPHPSFNIFNGANTSTATKLGTEVTNLGSGHEHGFSIPASDTQHAIYPAFSLSGDYVVKGSFTLQGTAYSCTVKVQVRAPGVRAELCWLEEGSNGDNDLDLHFGRLQNASGCADHGWFFTCTGGGDDDCYYANTSPAWAGYATSPDARCHGWGSLRSSSATCSNPRLDRDDISCTTSVTNPNAGASFCGPENINLDNPKVGDKFIAAAQCYNCSGSGHTNHPHMNLYCDGVRMFSGGYDPAATGTQYPNLTVSGQTTYGSLWTTAVITWNGDVDGGGGGDAGLMSSCTVDPVHSTTPNANDGSTQYCVENGPENKGNTSNPWWYMSTGGFPSGASQACWH